MAQSLPMSLLSILFVFGEIERATTLQRAGLEVVAKLRERGLMLGVCTNKRTDIAEQVLEHLGVRDLFGAVIGSDLASSPKPDAAHLTETLDALGADTAGCLYVGDTEIDALTAKSADVRYAHVEWGHQIDAPVAVQIREFSELLLHLDD